MHKPWSRLPNPFYGPVEALPNGARVRTGDEELSVNRLGFMKRVVGVASVYRNVFIWSGSGGYKPISLADQMRLHRRIHAAVRALR
jgi:hypothetical protein